MYKSILVLLFTIGLFGTIQAQGGDRQIQGDRWWYGAHVNLGFSSGTDPFSGLQRSILGLGISPMAGYKVTPALSVGPRAQLNYTNFRLRSIFGGDPIGEGVLDFGLGGFVRANIYRGFFAQGEIGYENRGQLFFDGSNFTEERIDGINAYIGAGYNNANSSGIAYEVMLAYDLNLLNFNTLDLLNYRVGFTLYY